MGYMVICDIGDIMVLFTGISLGLLVIYGSTIWVNGDNHWDYINIMLPGIMLIPNICHWD